MEKDLNELMVEIERIEGATALRTLAENEPQVSATLAIARALVYLCNRLDHMTGTITESETGKKALTVFDWSRNL